ncbi:MAG: ADP-ribosylglycohydrolase family protein [Chthoniobacteraceae bacterium]
MPGWDTLRKLVTEEFIQSQQEGKCPDAIADLEREFATMADDDAELSALPGRLLALPMRKDFPFQEPSDLETIRALRPSSRPGFSTSFSDDELADKMYGAWLGRCAGCALGKPVEGIGMMGAKPSWRLIKRYLTAISPDEWPLRDYFPGYSPAEGEPQITIWCKASTREQIAFMESDDDIRYTVLGQIVLNQNGATFTTDDVAKLWMARLPYKSVCTAETQVYRNLVLADEFHIGARLPRDNWDWVATHLNPYREWIGAQIRVDSYGYAAPGQPELAAEFAWRDARLSHVKNGIYGAMFCAAMIAASFATSDVREIIEAGLAEIPTTSRLYSELHQVIAICERHGNNFVNFESVFDELHSLLGHYSSVHTNNNAGLCIVALLLGGGDFHKGITLAVMGGWDTDCNGATVGSIVGAIAGAKQVPSHWAARLNDTLNSEIIGYHPIAISECARRSVVIARKIAS